MKLWDEQEMLSPASRLGAEAALARRCERSTMGFVDSKIRFDAPGEPGNSPAAREEELERLRRRVVAAVGRVCPPWLAEQAEDIVQNVLVQLVRYATESEGNRRWSSIYLQKAAYGATVDEIRKRCRRRETQAPAGGGLAEPAASPAAWPERRAASAEIASGIQSCLVELAKRRRLAVTLYLQGCSVPETARRLGWSRKKTENLVYRGLADLRQCLRLRELTP